MEQVAKRAASPEADSYFKTIPEEIFDNVLKFFSVSPGSLNWEKYIPLGDIAELYGVGGGLGTFVCSRFNGLCVSKTANCNGERRKYNWKRLDRNTLRTNDIKVARDFVMGAGGQYMRKIIIGIDGYDKSRDGEALGC